MVQPDSPTSYEQNHLLAALPQNAQARIFPRLTLVELSLGEVLNEPGENIKSVYFPTTCIISLLYVTENGDSRAFQPWWVQDSYLQCRTAGADRRP